MKKNQPIVCTLGSGSALGFAHIGVFKFLEEQQIPVHGIAGTSMGAIVGGLYAYGYRADELEEVCATLNTFEIAKWFFPTFPRGGLIDSDNVKKFLSSLIGTAKIENLPIPFRCVATDIVTGTEVVFDSGPLIDGIIASMSIQGMFKPYPCKGMYLCDGGLCNPVPWNIGYELGKRNLIVNVLPVMGYSPDGKRIVVRTSSLPREEGEEEETAFRNGIKNGRFRDSFKEIMGGLKQRRLSIQQIRDEIGHKEAEHQPSLMDVLMNWSFMNSVERRIPRPVRGKKYLLIKPDLLRFSPFDFKRGKEIIQSGYNAAVAQKEEIKKFVR